MHTCSAKLRAVALRISFLSARFGVMNIFPAGLAVEISLLSAWNCANYGRNKSKSLKRTIGGSASDNFLSLAVITGLVPVIHRTAGANRGMDPRHKAGDDIWR